MTTAAMLLAVAPPLAVKAEPIVLDTAKGSLHGTLEVPKGRPPWPVVLIIAGSGPTDRDGNSRLIKGKSDYLKLLALGLARRGIASLRYDKRGVAASRGAAIRESDLSVGVMIDDVAAWGRKLRRDKRFKTLTVLGHSEGSLLGMIAARRLKADGYVSLAGPGRPAGRLILWQLKPKVPAWVYRSLQAIVAGLESGRQSRLVLAHPGMGSLFRLSVQPYLISWFRLDPGREIARLEMPVLIIGGTTDIQVPVSEARFLARANPKAKLVIIKDMNHVLKSVPGLGLMQGLSYRLPHLPLAPGLVEAVAGFVKSLKRP